MKKRIFTLILALLMTVPLFFACKTGKSGGDTTMTEKPNVIPQDTYKSKLVKEDFKGAEVNILILPDRKSWSFCESEPTNVFETEVYRRNAWVEEFYNVSLNVIPGSQQSASFFSTACRNSSLEQSSLYDIVSPDYYYGIVEEGYFIDMAARREIKLDNPYWVSGWNQNTTINGKNYAPVGFFTLDPVAKAEALYSNNSMVDALGIPSIYETVKAGEWTLEKMNEYIALAANPDKDGAWTFDATYGLCANLWSGRALMTSAGYRLSEFDDGSIAFSIVNDRNIKIFEDIYSLFNTNVGAYYCGGTKNSAGYRPDGERDTDLFLAGHALFLAHSLSELRVIGSTFTNYNAYPMPKHDETQENYVSTILGTSIFGVMKNAKNIHMSCTLLEALCVVSYEDVLPVYYDRLLRERYSQNKETAEMIDLIRNSVWVDFLFINSTSFDLPNLPSVANLAFDMIANKNNTFASTMASYPEGLSAKWRDFKEFYD